MMSEELCMHVRTILLHFTKWIFSQSLLGLGKRLGKVTVYSNQKLVCVMLSKCYHSCIANQMTLVRFSIQLM